MGLLCLLGVVKSFLSFLFFQVINGYFVHHFSPEGIPSVRKHVVFVIDESGSMTGIKIAQTREAMVTILDQLNEGDTYNIVTFRSSVKTWEANRMVPVTPTTIERGKSFSRNLQATGCKWWLLQGVWEWLVPNAERDHILAMNVTVNSYSV